MDSTENKTVSLRANFETVNGVTSATAEDGEGHKVDLAKLKQEEIKEIRKGSISVDLIYDDLGQPRLLLKANLVLIPTQEDLAMFKDFMRECFAQ